MGGRGREELQEFRSYRIKKSESCLGLGFLRARAVSQESGVRSQESGVRSQESGVRSQESGVRSQESGVSSLALIGDCKLFVFATTNDHHSYPVPILQLLNSAV
jgi:hypothetical protein